ncbi:MAG: hypothetical protein ACKPBV_24190 [Sphaerospermopsis kisseleviana]
MLKSIFSGFIGVTLWAWFAASVGSQSTVLDVVVPNTATVVRKQGTPLTGRLTAFGEIKLTLEAGGYSKTVPLNQVDSVSFEGDVWIEGRSLPSRIRGYIKTWSGVPIKAFKLQKSAQSAQVDLNKVIITNDEQKMINNKEKVQVLSKISFDSPQKMMIETFSMTRCATSFLILICKAFRNQHHQIIV